MRDRAGTDLHHVVRPVPAQPGDAVIADGELHPGPPAESGLIAGHRLDGDIPLDAGDAPQLLADNRGLERALGAQAGVLPVAAAAAARMRVRAGRLHPVGRGGQDLHRVGPGEPRCCLGHYGADALSGQRMPDEDHRASPGRGAGPTGIRPGYAPAAVRYLADAELEQLARSGQVPRGCAHWRASGTVLILRASGTVLMPPMLPWLRGAPSPRVFPGLVPLCSRYTVIGHHSSGKESR